MTQSTITFNYRLFFMSLALCTQLNAERIIDTVWGKEVITDPLIEELLDNEVMTRLESIDQSGPHLYFGITPKFDRLSHSKGVWALVQRAGRTQKECAAALMHDASHTVFSHLGDVIFKKDTTKGVYEEKAHSYQDEIHLYFLKQHGIDAITEKYNIPLEDLNPDLEDYKALEQPLPDMCADRIQYNIHTGVVFNMISTDDACDIVYNLCFDGTHWYFTDPVIAKKFAHLSVHFTKYLWGAPYNGAFYHYFARALRRALELNIITHEDIHFSTDRKVFDILKESNDAAIMHAFELCNNIYQSFMTVPYGQGDLNIKPKCRAINPLVLVDNEFKRLSELDQDFAKEFNAVYQWCKDGYGLLLYE